jgi:hypothetical protein
MTTSDGAMDASVFPPFIPGAPPARRPAEPAPEAAAPEPADDEPRAEHADFDYGADESAGAGYSTTLPEEEAPEAGPDFGDAAEDLPWLDLAPGARTSGADEESGRYEPEPFRPEPLEAEPFDLTAMDAQGGGEAGTQHGTPAENGAFPDWLAWDAQDATEAEAEIAEAAPEPWAEDVIPGDDFMQMEAAAQDSAADAAPWTEDLPVGDGSLEVDLPGPGDEVEERPSPAASASPAATAGPVAIDAAAAEALAEVAGRLERIARTLRDDPGDLLAGGSADPLDLLVAGYALGLAQGRAQGRSG